MGKAEILLKVIKDIGIAKEQALMIGDSYFYDYVAAKDSGIDAFWIKNGVAKRSDNVPKDLQSIHEVHEILNLYEW